MQLCHLTTNNNNINDFFDYMFDRDPENDKLLTVPGLVDAEVDAYPLMR